MGNVSGAVPREDPIEVGEPLTSSTRGGLRLGGRSVQQAGPLLGTQKQSGFEPDHHPRLLPGRVGPGGGTNELGPGDGITHLPVHQDAFAPPRPWHRSPLPGRWGISTPATRESHIETGGAREHHGSPPHSDGRAFADPRPRAFADPGPKSQGPGRR